MSRRKRVAGFRWGSFIGDGEGWRATFRRTLPDGSVQRVARYLTSKEFLTFLDRSYRTVADLPGVPVETRAAEPKQAYNDEASARTWLHGKESEAPFRI
jgi:hypothetical protein